MDRYRQITGDAGTAECLRLLDGMDFPAFIVREDGSCLLANWAWRVAFGDSPDEPWAWLAPVPASDRSRLTRLLSQAIAERRGVELEFEARRSDGSMRSLSCHTSPYRGERGELLGFVGVCWDVTARRYEAERLAFIAGHDPLTGLANRRSFLEALERAASRAGRGTESTLVLVDMDHLKAYNDERGHLAGDQALINLSMMLRAHVRAGDLVSRIGGDEFAVLLEGAPLDEAVEIADRMRLTAALEEFVPGARELGLGISAGVTPIVAGVDVPEIIDRADAALYVAKAAGRDRVVVWEPGMGTHATPERLAQRVRDAFSEDGFILVFQPVLDLRGRGVAYAESLVRLRCADGRLLGPSEFLPVVERLGRMPELTERVVNLAIDAIGPFGGCPVSVNLGAADLGNRALLERICEIVAERTVPEGRLAFEIAESVLLGNPAGGHVWMECLGGLGCPFVLDDFGTGMGMFMLLQEPAIKQVKLSRTAVQSLASEDGARAFVSALRELIESHGKVAVAAYLESESLVGRVVEAGFRLGQGYRVGEPTTDIESIVAMIGSGLGRD